MFSGYRPANFFFFIVILLGYCFNDPSSARLCYECASTFPASQICRPSCSASYRPISTCLLTRNIPLGPGDTGSLRAGHIDEEPVLADAAEKNFLYGEEAVYLNPSVAVGWDWEYGSITYGCDTDNCNDPTNVNSLPAALNARIPDATLNQLLTGSVVSQCYTCSKCINESSSAGAMDGCEVATCPGHACSLVVSRGSPQCGNNWRFASGCLGSREPAQIDMTLMYYIRSNTTLVYQMEAVCLSDNCNTFSTFQQLRDAIQVRPDLTCLINTNTTGTTLFSTSSTTGSGTTTQASTPGPGATTTSTGGIIPTTTSGSRSAQTIAMDLHVALALLSFPSLKSFF